MTELIDHPDIAKLLVLLEVFCEKVAAIAILSSRYNQGIPPGKLESVLDEPCAFDNIRVHGYGVPNK